MSLDWNWASHPISAIYPDRDRETVAVELRMPDKAYHHLADNLQSLCVSIKVDMYSGLSGEVLTLVYLVPNRPHIVELIDAYLVEHAIVRNT